MSSSQKLKRKDDMRQERTGQKDEMKDFIVDDHGQYGYGGSSDSGDEFPLNGANLEDAPRIQQTKANMKISGKKIEEIFAENSSESDSDDDLEELIAKKNEIERRKNAVLGEVLDPSKYNEIMENSRAKQKPAPTAQKINNSIDYPTRILTPAEIQKRFKELPDTINIYLTEVYQNHTDKRKLYVFGMTENGDRVSIQIKDVNRCLYFMMREGVDDEQRIEDEIRQRLKQAGIDEYDGELMKMGYIFEIEGIPRGDVLVYRVQYSFALDLPNPPKPDWEGKTFKYVIGTTYSALELFVVKNKIKGPQWISLEKSNLTTNNKLHGVVGLPLELIVPESVVINKEVPKTPKLKVISFAVKVTKPADVKKNNIFPSSAQRDKPIIYTISIQYHSAYNMEAKTKNLVLQSTVFYLSSLGSVPAQNKNVKFVRCENELELISRFLEAIEGFDPDVLACHDATMALDTVISRCDFLNIKEKARLGRLGSSRLIPNITNMKQRQMLVLAGRLLVDTYIHAKDLLKSVDYSLSFLSSNNPIGMIHEDIKPDQANTMLANGEFIKLLNHCNSESEGAFNLMNHLQIIQLTKQLTNICGNLWRRSLDNARAERNQYLMMHFCEGENFIIPDKFYREKDAEEDAKKEKYEGGYVIEPEKDLYTEYILLLDFNSLYPSIIRQYNICFSKVHRNLHPLSYYYRPRAEGQRRKKNDPKTNEKRALSKQECKMIVEQMGEDEEEPNVCQKIEEPKPKFKVEPVEENLRGKDNWGFLPLLINYIVSKRTEYKKKMVGLASLPQYEFEKRQDEYMAFEVTQRSYKLVANSIYGCLGFENSRFYARDLAALITQKGRDALKRAKQLVEKSRKATVIYGDTDSLMIKIDMEENLTQVEKINKINVVASNLKKDINRQYTNKMLEIDIDGVFKPLNLIAKKKYMAKKLVNFDKVVAKGVAPVFTVEYKGIEVAKRDGCQRSRKAIKDIFDIVLNNMVDIENAKTQIYDYFEKLDQQMVEMNANLEYKNYLLAKQLNKHPSQYKNGAENLPHIRVAKKLIENGEKAEKLVNHAIYYLIIETDKEKASVADKAVDEASFLRSLKTSTPMKIDINHYKVHEILPPIIRVLANIKTIDIGYIKQKFKIPNSFQKDLDRLEQDDQGHEFTNDQYEPMKAIHDTKINSTFGPLKCPGLKCDKTYPICKDNIITSECKDKQCQYNLQNSLHGSIQNIIAKYMYQKSMEFTAPKYKCTNCNKVWKVQIKECCKDKKFQPNTHASDLHNTLYCLQKVVGSLPPARKNKPDLREWLNRFFKGSQFEVIEEGFMRGLKLTR